MGFVYKYVGTVPEGENRAAYITHKFAEAAGSNQVSTMVSDIGTFGITVIYYHSDTDNIKSSNFELIMDLIPYPPPEPFVEPVPPSSDEQSLQG